MSPTADDTLQDQADTTAQQAGSADGAPDPAVSAAAERAATADELLAQAQTAFEDSEHDGHPLGEHIMQRGRYFENLVDHLFDHITTLNAMLSRTGTAVPPMPHFPSLKSPIGDFHPNNRG